VRLAALFLCQTPRFSTLFWYVAFSRIGQFRLERSPVHIGTYAREHGVRPKKRMRNKKSSLPRRWSRIKAVCFGQLFHVDAGRQAVWP